MTPPTDTTANGQWWRALHHVMNNGSPHSPRGHRTLEVLNFTSVVDMRYPVVTYKERKLSTKFMTAEALWILQGSNRVEGIAPYAKAIIEFSDDGYRFQGAYGPQVGEQLRYVCDTLLEDNSSRQAIITIWRANPRKSKDIPCTVSLQFLIRDGKINCIANMRSSDLWLGWVYDVFNFTMITSWIAIRLKEMGGIKCELGNLYLNAGSQHIYERNYDGVRSCLQAATTGYNCPLNLSVYDTPSQLETHLIHARDTLRIEDSLFFHQLRHV